MWEHIGSPIRVLIGSVLGPKGMENERKHLLSYFEYKTPAMYHAKREVLQKLDRVQSKLLSDIGVDEVTALIEFNLAPLSARRDMAMLGVIHRTVLGKGPRHFKQHFVLDSDGRIVDPRRKFGGELIKRSALGLVAIYNLLPAPYKKVGSVKDFQRILQDLLKERVSQGCLDFAHGSC